MAIYQPHQIRNVALLSHPGAGKTSLAEALLFGAGMIPKMGSVEAGTTVTDFDPDEVRRKMTIYASLCHLDSGETKVNLVDTPGYPDLGADVLAALQVVEGVVIAVDAGAGVEVRTEMLWEYAEERALPVLFFVNKMDKENADFEAAVTSIRETLTPLAFPLALPVGRYESYRGVLDGLSRKFWEPGPKAEKGSPPAGELEGQLDLLGERLVEMAAEGEDELTEKYLEGTPLSPEEIRRGLRASVRRRKAFPILAGAASRASGVKMLIDAMTALLPSPADGTPVKASRPSGQVEEVRADPQAPCRVLVWRTIVDPYVGRFSLLRVFSGTLGADMVLANAQKGVRERISQPLLLQGKTQQAVDRLLAGDMGALGKLAETGTLETLCSGEPVVLPAPALREPVFAAAVKPHSRADEDKLTGALARISEEDLGFRYARDAETGDTVLYGAGPHHLDVVLERLQERFKVSVDVGQPKVPYRESITRTVEAEGRHKKQTGGRGQFGDVHLRIEPLARGGGFEFNTEVKGGVVPSNFFPAVERGVVDGMSRGPLAGYPVVDVRAVLCDGSTHPVDSSDIAFRLAGSLAFRKAVELAHPILLEPIDQVEVVVPEEFMGSVMGSLTSKRGKVLGTEQRKRNQAIRAAVPHSEVGDFARELVSLSSGRGTLAAHFSHYEPAPAHVTESVVKRRQQEKEQG